MSDRFLVDLFAVHAQMAEFMASEQRKQSINLIRVKHELGLNQRQMAALLQRPYDDYLELEFSSRGIPLGAYELAFDRLSKITDADIALVIKLPSNEIES